MSEDADSSTTFLRQRRDLFVISAILLLIPIAEIEGAGHITMPFIGVSMYIGKPEIITYSLWILWAYWYLRYFQAYIALDKKLLSNKFTSLISSYSYKTFWEMAEAGKSDLLKIDDFAKETNIGFSFDSQNYYFMKAEYLCKYDRYDPTKSKHITHVKILIFKGMRYKLVQLKTLFMFIFKNIEVTEYGLPFIFGIAPLFYYLAFR